MFRDLGKFTLTGLDWLDFDGGPAPSTVNRSYNDVTSQLGAGGQYAGWHYAARSDVINFVFNITGVTLAADGELPAYAGMTEAVASFTGFTDDGSDPFFRQIAAIDGDLISPFIHRFSQMLFVPSHAPTTDKYLGGDDNILSISDESAIPAIGRWLVTRLGHRQLCNGTSPRCCLAHSPEKPIGRKSVALSAFCLPPSALPSGA